MGYLIVALCLAASWFVGFWPFEIAWEGSLYPTGLYLVDGDFGRRESATVAGHYEIEDECYEALNDYADGRRIPEHRYILSCRRKRLFLGNTPPIKAATTPTFRDPGELACYLAFMNNNNERQALKTCTSRLLQRGTTPSLRSGRTAAAPMP